MISGENGFYTLKEMCELLGVSRSTLDRMAQKKLIPGRVKIGGQIRYHKASVSRWITDQVRHAG